MKNTTAILLFFILIVGLMACVTQAKIQYNNFPSDIAEEAKIANTKMIERGRVLYNINCAQCHNKKIKNKIYVPDFTSDQLDTYILRINNEAHLKTLPETRVTSEEIQDIQFFFSYKKPSLPIKENSQ
jgi:mono/diheme cytochrome c family protein